METSRCRDVHSSSSLCTPRGDLATLQLSVYDQQKRCHCARMLGHQCDYCCHVSAEVIKTAHASSAERCPMSKGHILIEHNKAVSNETS